MFAELYKSGPKETGKAAPSARALAEICVGDAYLYALYSREPAALGFGFVV